MTLLAGSMETILEKMETILEKVVNVHDPTYPIISFFIFLVVFILYYII